MQIQLSHIKGILLFVFIPFISFAQLPAFPGAQGAGRYTTGGRYGDIYHVSTLNNDGAGSLRDAITTAPTGGRTIVFDISGNITLTSRLKIDKNNLTIAGQTSPGQGICIKGRVSITGNNIILRHLHFRPDEITGDGDAVNIGGHDIIVDHCSASWSSDEVMSTDAADVYNITIQWSYIYEGLNVSYHYENGVLIDHSMGSLFTTLHDAAVFSVHHNLYAHNRTRNPKPTSGGANISLYFDFRNNVIYDWGSKAGYSTDESDRNIYMNYIGNFLVAGPSTKSSAVEEAFEGLSNTMHIFQSDNLIDGNRNGITDALNTGWNMITGTYLKEPVAYDLPYVSTFPADSTFEQVLSKAGAMWWNRDAADFRVTEDVRNGSGKIIDWPAEVGGWPAIPVTIRVQNWDSDQDGMPDFWELLYNSEPYNPADGHTDTDGDGYTNIEEYLNAIPVDLGNPVAVNLRSFTATMQNNAVALCWTTEENGQLGSYTLERAESPGQFYPIRTVSDKPGATLRYHTIYDAALPASLLLYYRLNYEDISGKSTYSAIKVVKHNPVNNIIFYPNPAKDKLFLSSNRISKIEIFTIEGSKVKEEDIRNNRWINLTGMEAGTYILKLYSGKQVTVRKILKIN